MVGSPLRRQAGPMSANPDFPPPPPPSNGGRGRLTRSRSDRMLAGVAGGLGRYFGLDPVIARVAFVVLLFFGGAGALLYLAAVLLVPNEDDAVTVDLTKGGQRERSSLLVALGVIALVCVFGVIVGPIALAASAVVVPLLFLMILGLGIAWLVTGRRPDREPASIVRAVLLGLGLLTLTFALAAASFWGAGIGGDTVVAGAVIAAGVGMVVAAFFRPARWLVLPALALAIPAGFVAAAGIDLHGGYGERTYRPGSIQALDTQYELAMGQITLDLRDVDFPRGDTALDLDVGLGEAVLIVPEDLCVTTDATMGAGRADVFDRGSEGVDVDWRDDATAKPGGARLVVDADLGIGHLDIRNTDTVQRYDRFDRSGPSWREWDERRGSNDGCAA